MADADAAHSRAGHAASEEAENDPRLDATLCHLVDESAWAGGWTRRVPYLDVDVDGDGDGDAALLRAALSFVRDYVANNAPCVLRGLTKTWRPLPASWAELMDAAGGASRVVKCNATPTGRGDAVVRDAVGEWVFCKPAEVDVTLGELAAFLERRPGADARGVLYLSQQDGSLDNSFPSYVERGFAPRSIPLGDLAFGKRADACNLWIGDERAVSTVHRDVSYENLYVCLRGEKVFHLLAPCAAPFLGERDYPGATYVPPSAPGLAWDVRRDEGAPPAVAGTTWIRIDPAHAASAVSDFPPFARVADRVTEVRLRPGDALYLPAGWFHRVTQSTATVGVNYWYDRHFGALWATQNALEAYARRVV